MCGVIRDQLAAARRRAFVGRRDELALFERLLRDGAAAVVHVHGPGGIGKTTLLHQVADLAEERGRRVVRLDAEGCGQSADAVEAEWARRHRGGDEPLVLLVDGADHLAGLERWLREEFLARLPGGSLAVLAGRSRPSLGWRADPGWRGLLHTVPMQPLSDEDSREVLRRRGLDGTDQGPALDFARGHPLALVLAADAGSALPAPGSPPEALRDLLRVLLSRVPSPRHRAAIEASAVVLVTTEPLLAAMIGEPAGELFAWLRELPIVEPTERGIRPHDLLRDLVLAELRWRDPAEVNRLRERARRQYRARLDGGDPVLFDLAYLHRDSPLLGPFLACVTPVGWAPSALAVTPMRAGEWPLLREWLVRHEGEASAALADRWAGTDTVSVVRGDGGEAIGFMLVLRLDRLEPAARAADPATAAAWASLPDPAAGPAVQLRTWLERDAYQAVSPAQTRMIFHLMRSFLSIPRLTYTFLPVADAVYWSAAGAYVDLHRLPEADFAVGGRSYATFAHDWTAVPPAAWLERVGAVAEVAAPSTADGRAPSTAGGRAPSTAGGPALDDAAFAAAVRDALRELGRPDRLGAGPLAATALAAGPDPAAALQGSIRRAAEVLRSSPRDRRAYRALHHTYLQPAGTQQIAADLLGLPMSTYRRHLAEGLRRLTDLLRAAERKVGGD